MDARARQVSFMSKQKRVNRSQLLICTGRVGSRMYPHSRSHCAVRLCGCEGSNGPGLVDPVVGMGLGGHKISVFGSPHQTARSASS